MKKMRDVSENFAELIPIPKDIQKLYKDFGYDSCLHIRIYGDPFSDSRPRLNKATMGVGLKNMNEMKKVFKPLYDESELLQNLTIVSPFHIHGIFYRKPTKADIKFIKKSNKKVKSLYTQHKLGDLSIKDVDNMLKIHNDILFSEEFRITLDDAWNVGFHKAEKYLSENDFADIFVYYASKPNAYYLWKMMQNHSYFCWLISEKHMRMNNRTPEQQMKHLRKIIREEMESIKSEVDMRTLIRRSFKVLEEYPATLIKQVADMTDAKYTKSDAQYKVMLLICKGNKIAEKIIERGGMSC